MPGLSKGGCFRHLVGVLSCCLAGVDGEDTIFSSRALRLLRTAPTTLQGGVVKVCAVQLVDAYVLQWLTFRTDVAVFFRQISKLLDPVQIALRHRTFLDTDIRCDLSLNQPVQQFAIA